MVNKDPQTPLMQDRLKRFFQLVEQKDVEAVLECFTPDAVFYDPHYPQPLMRGLEQIRQGLLWGFASMRQFNFHLLHILSEPQANTVAVVTDCRHLITDSKRLNIKQVFIFTFERQHISELRAFEPYGPGGLMGCMLKISHWFWKLRRRLSGDS